MLRDGLSLPANSTLVNDLAAYYISGGGTAAFAQYALENYESDEDYWLIKMNGDIVGTPGDPKIYREVYDKDGNIKTELVPGSNETGSQAASLVALLGEERVRELLSPQENGISFLKLDYQAIREVLGDRVTIPRDFADTLFSYISYNAQQRILGESLLRQNGYSWNEETGTWEGSGLNIAAVAFGGNVGVVKDGAAYVPFTVTSDLYRNTDAFTQYVYQNGKWEENSLYKNNTIATYTYTNLKTGGESVYAFQGPLNFVDILDGSDPIKGGANQPYNHPVYGTVQGATVSSSAMNQRIITQGTYGEVLLFTDFTDLKGDLFGKNGMRAGISYDPRTLYHWTKNGYSDSCLVSFSVAGGLSGEEYFEKNMSYLKNKFNLYTGLEIKTRLIQYQW
jgi:hypothetical protein